MTTAHTHAARPIDLALQGGSSHGAFTWGVLDGLLEDGRLLPDGVSGTSAGAMNAAVLATGYARGGRDGARAALKAFWHAVSDQNPAPAPAMTALGMAWPDWLFNRRAWPGYNAMEAWTRLLSPAQSTRPRSPARHRQGPCGCGRDPAGTDQGFRHRHLGAHRPAATCCIGRHAAQAWLAQHADAVGHQGTLDAAKVYLGQGTDVNAAP